MCVYVSEWVSVVLFLFLSICRLKRFLFHSLASALEFRAHAAHLVSNKDRTRGRKRTHTLGVKQRMAIHSAGDCLKTKIKWRDREKRGKQCKTIMAFKMQNRQRDSEIMACRDDDDADDDECGEWETHAHLCVRFTHPIERDQRPSFVRSFVWFDRLFVHGLVSPRLDKPVVHVHQKQRKHFSGKCMHSAFYTFNSLVQPKKNSKNNLCSSTPCVRQRIYVYLVQMAAGKGQNNHLATHSHTKVRKKKENKRED